jgi:uncharacterized membrane protein
MALPASAGVVLGAAATTTAATLNSAAAAGTGQAAVAVTTTVVAKAVAIGLGIGLAVNAAIFVPGMLTRAPKPVATTAFVVSPAKTRGISAVHSAISLSAPALVSEATSLNEVSKATPNETDNRAAASTYPRNNERSPLALPTPRATIDQSPYSDKLREESQLLMQARQALNAFDGDRALELLAEHRRYFANGALTQERDVLEVQSLVKVGRVNEARAHARAFLTRFPMSPHNEKMRAIAEMPTAAR